jgi:hypothetical protein
MAAEPLLRWLPICVHAPECVAKARVSVNMAGWHAPLWRELCRVSSSWDMRRSSLAGSAHAGTYGTRSLPGFL